MKKIHYKAARVVFIQNYIYIYIYIYIYTHTHIYMVCVCACAKDRGGCARSDVWKGVHRNLNPVCLWGVEFGVIYTVLFLLFSTAEIFYMNMFYLYT